MLHFIFSLLSAFCTLTVSLLVYLWVSNMHGHISMPQRFPWLNSATRCLNLALATTRLDPQPQRRALAFKHLPTPQLGPLHFIDGCIACVLMIYSCASHNQNNWRTLPHLKCLLDLKVSVHILQEMQPLSFVFSS